MIIFNHFYLCVQRIVLIIFSCFSLISFAFADVSSFEITSRQPYADGLSFGDVGAYEKIIGRIHYEIDPANSLNQVIADIDLAPLNDRGMIEMSGDQEMIAPLIATNGNGVAFIDMPNRGNGRLLNFNQANTERPYGDGFLMQEGYTLVFVAWEFDLDRGMRLDVPLTTDNEAMPIAGLGFAAARDVASWIKYSPDAIVSSETLLGFGLSQSGRFLRSYLYLGFNTDEAGRKVFDGVIPHIAGASVMDMNKRGATPISTGQFDSTMYPFADEAYRDSVTGSSEGVLENPRAIQNQPHIFYTNTSVEYWGGARAAALVHSTPNGEQDIALPENVRFYLLASSQHVPVAFPQTMPVDGQELSNQLNYWWHMRALLTALKDWVLFDTEPPASAHPTLNNNTLVALEQVDFPLIPGVHSTTNLFGGVRLGNPLLEGDAGAGTELPYLLPQVNQDGNETSGVLNPEIVVPLATYTGWNFYHPDKGDPDTVVTNQGSYIPFTVDQSSREAANDPRLSIEERYSNKQDFLDKISRATQESIDARYILAADKAEVIERASQHWDLLRN